MRFSLTSLLSTLIWAGAGISVVAIGLGRAAPKTATGRTAAAPRYQGYNGRFFSSKESHPRFLDRETGGFVHVDLPEKDSLEYAACSPWRDDRGQYHVASRWMNRSGQGSNLMLLEFGLARYTFPEGRMLDRVALDVMPVGEPCWFPDRTPRILFAAGDGHLYRHSFDDEAEGGPARDPEEAQRPRPVNWRTIPPGLGMLYIKDLFWPTGPQLGGRVLASLSYQVRVEDRVRFLGSQLWWFTLSEDGTAIEEARRLTVPEHDDLQHALDREERLPSVATTSGGDLVLAYLTRSREQAQWALRVAPIEKDPTTGAPVVGSRDGRDVADSCIPAPPAFSTDGRWVYGLLGDEHYPGLSGTVATRFPVAADLASRAPSRRVGVGVGTRLLLGLAGHDLPEFAASRLVDRRAGRHARR